MIPDLSGKHAIVTGATNGIGYEAARALAAHAATVILAVRDPVRGEACAAKIRAEYPHATLRVEALDLTNLASVRACAERIDHTTPCIDILINNAGLGLQPDRAVTADGFERMFGTNQLGHFALTAQLIPALLRAPAARIVTIASIAHLRGRIDFADLQTEHPYSARKAYGQSKLANLMFAFELDRRARAAGSRLMSVAAHPGVAATGFITATAMGSLKVRAGNLLIDLFGNSAIAGAEPGLYAATMPEITGGQYWGPDGFMEIRGGVALAKIGRHARDQAVWRQLWQSCEQLTGVIFPPLG